MASTWAIERLPQIEAQLRQLTDQHRELRDEPLHLAVAFQRRDDPQGIYLFEVVGHFAAGEISPDSSLFEVTFTPSPMFPIPEGQHLHLLLTSPEEIRVALEQNWPSADEIRHAIRDGNYKELFADSVGQQVLGLMHG